MDKMLRLLRALGNAGAVANASELREQHRHEEWILRGLALRVATVPATEEAAAAVAG